MFNEIKRVGEINFEFAERSSPMSYTLKLANKLQHFKADETIPDILKHMYVVEELDRSRIQQMSDLIADPANLNVYLRSKTF